MKHWNTLTALESALIRLGEFKNLFELLTDGVDNGSTQEVLNSAIYTMSGMIEDINEEAMSHFYTLWEEVRQDSENESDSNETVGQQWMKGTEPYNPDEEEAFKRLEAAINGWRKVSTS